MALSGIQPFIKVLDSNGDPIVGAKLHVYEAGTTTYRNIYSDDGLSVALSNPLSGANASDASGDFPRFYTAAGTYKLRAVTSADVLIWEEDDIDTGLSAGSGALPIASGGTSATTAAAARAALGAASTTEVEEIADQIASLSSSLQSVIGQPGGRLTLTSATPVLVTGVTAGTAVYYTPYTSTQCPIYDGAQFNLETFAELTLTLASQHTASNIFDCFIINDSGTIRIVTGPAWTTATAGSGARGTGAGTTELTRQNGIWVNANAMATARNGSSTYSVDAKEGTYVGSLFIDGTNGQISCLTAYGQSRKWGVWNAYNRIPIFVKAGDATATWSYTNTATIRAANGSSSNAITIFSGLPEEWFDLKIRSTTFSSALTGIHSSTSGIGYNSTTAFSGTPGYFYFTPSANNYTFDNSIVGSYMAPPSIGIQTITANEATASGATVTSSWRGTETYMLLSAMWMG